MSIYFYDLENGNKIESFKGLVVDKGKRRYKSESDFYAVVFDPKKNTFVEIDYASTRCFCDNICDIDANKELKKIYKEWSSKRKFK